MLSPRFCGEGGLVDQQAYRRGWIGHLQKCWASRRPKPMCGIFKHDLK